MPYTKQHKQETHERILRTAARALRESGISGVGIGELMAQAGLTHGGFYAHFPSKDALVAAACVAGMAEAGDALFAGAEQAEQTSTESGGAALRHLLRAYLSRSHRDHPESGCVLPALAADIARSSDEVRSAFTAGLHDYLDRLEALLPEDEADRREDAALALLSGVVGALLLARAVDDPRLSDRILAAGRTHLGETFAGLKQEECVGAHDTKSRTAPLAEPQGTHAMAQGDENPGDSHAQ